MIHFGWNALRGRDGETKGLGGREGEREKEVKAAAGLERIPVTRNDRSPFVRRLNDRGETLTYTLAAIVYGICWYHLSLSSIYALPSFRFPKPRLAFDNDPPPPPFTNDLRNVVELPPIFHPPDIILPLDSRIPVITTAN